ncbi:hypothetical protein HDU83_007878 [Entophlyctis luteolus]|nr:hypothetical protein HDU83_007878 [Entophlyctis luteolus]
MCKLADNGVQPGCVVHQAIDLQDSVFDGIPSANVVNKGFASQSAKPSYAPHSRILPSHLKIMLDARETSLRSKTVKAQVCIQLSVPNSSVGSVAVDRELVLDACNLRIDAVSGADSWSYDGQKLRLEWNSNYRGGSVVIDYIIESPITGLFFHVPDKLVPTRALHCLTDHETERARYWLPCIDYPLARTTLEFHITHNSKHTCVANGIHESTIAVADDSDLVVTTYRLMNHTCPSYLICWAVGDFVVAEDTSVDGMPIKYFCSRDSHHVTPEALKVTFAETPGMIRWLQKKVGSAFPWEKYYQIVSPKVEGGAMENISLVTYRDVYLYNNDAANDGWREAVDSVNIHEMAHTYFGDLITIRHFEHVWLKESWATFISSVWSEDHHSHEFARYDHFLNMEYYMREAQSYVRPIVCKTYDSSWDMFDSHTYPGGAYRLHMLRFILGEDTFWTGVRNYVSTFSGKYAETEDFKRCLESASGLNLTKFFDQWIYGKGYPKIKAAFVCEPGNVCKITLEQTQGDRENDVPAVFEIVVEVDVVDLEGKVHSTIVSFSESTGPKVTVFVTLGNSKPDFVEIDPRGKVLHSLDFNPGLSVLEAGARRGRDIGTRINCYRQLVKLGTIPSLKAVSEALREEHFFGVRAQVYAALSESKLRDATCILADSLVFEQEARALRALTFVCTIKDERIRQELKTLLNENRASRLTARIKRNIYANIGRQRHPEDIDFLIAARRSTPPYSDTHNFILEGIVAGLGHHRSSRCFDELVDLVFSRDESTGARIIPETVCITAVDAIGAAAIWQDASRRREVAEQLAELVQMDTAHRLRKAGIRALVALQEDGRAHYAICEGVARTAFAAQDTQKLVEFVKGMRNLDHTYTGQVTELKKVTSYMLYSFFAANLSVFESLKTVELLEEKLKRMEAIVMTLEAKDSAREEAHASE